MTSSVTSHHQIPIKAECSGQPQKPFHLHYYPSSKRRSRSESAFLWKKSLAQKINWVKREIAEIAAAREQ